MKLFAMDVKLCATAYVIAENEAEAADIVREHFGEHEGGELPTGYISDEAEVYGGSFHSDMPAVSLSPAVTFYGPWDPVRTEAWLADEFESEDEDADA